MSADVATTLFPTDLPGRDWQQFPAAGFATPVAGVVYRLQDTVTNGLALGGVDTGCIDLETNGTWGYCTVFNSHVPRRGPIGSPVLGLHAAGRTWVLAAPRQSSAPALKPVAAWLPPPAVAGKPDLGPAQPAWAVASDNVPGWCRSVGGSAYDFPAGRAGPGLWRKSGGSAASRRACRRGKTALRRRPPSQRRRFAA
jgi:hypothetical protein